MGESYSIGSRGAFFIGRTGNTKGFVTKQEAFAMMKAIKTERMNANGCNKGKEKWVA